MNANRVYKCGLIEILKECIFLVNKLHDIHAVADVWEHNNLSDYDKGTPYLERPWNVDP